MKKTFAVFAAMMLAAFAPAEETEATAVATEESSGTKLKNAISEFVTDVGTSTTSTVKKKQIASKLKNITGTWTFANGDDSTALVINSDGTMAVTQGDGTASATWRGSCTAATSNQLTFTVTRKETAESAEDASEAWLLKYDKLEENELKITSDDLPDDTNGYDFSNATLFLRK